MAALISLRIHGWETNAKDLPGSPDIVLRNERKLIFVHGCFWHVHPGCPGMRVPQFEDPAKRIHWWGKLARNVLRDREAEATLRALGWEVLVVWECETGNRAALRARICSFVAGCDVALF
jgi:DNA mismatch endonuclease (patch repair protein)